MAQKYDMSPTSAMFGEYEHFNLLFAKGNTITTTGIYSFTSSTSSETYSSANGGEMDVLGQLKAALNNYMALATDLNAKAEVSDLTTLQDALSSHTADYEYQTPTISETQVQLVKQSDTNILKFKLGDDLSGGEITISLDEGATSKPLVDIDGNPVTELSKGFAEVVEDAVNFTLRPRGGGDAEFFGDGSDGILNTTDDVTFAVTAHTGIVIKQYKDVIINAGHTLTTNNPCQALVIYSQKDIIIDGTIDMSGKSAKYPGYFILPHAVKIGEMINALVPPMGGAGGGGGNGGTAKQGSAGIGGTGITFGSWFGGGCAGGGGGGGAGTSSGSSYAGGGNGGAASYSDFGTGGNSVYLASTGTAKGKKGLGGSNGAGGSGGAVVDSTSGSAATSGDGGSAVSGSGAGGGGGAFAGFISVGTAIADYGDDAIGFGGGCIVLVAKGDIILSETGSIKCNGANGGNGGKAQTQPQGSLTAGAGGGGGGGGNGGGSVLICHKGAFTNNNTIEVDGGLPGSGGAGAYGNSGSPGVAGTIGSISINQILGGVS